jgi:hypothetical protein
LRRRTTFKALENNLIFFRRCKTLLFQGAEKVAACIAAGSFTASDHYADILPHQLGPCLASATAHTRTPKARLF